jgi:hypothetical protein
MQQSKPLATYLLRGHVGEIRGAYGLAATGPTTTKAADIRSKSPSRIVLDRRVFRADFVLFREADRSDAAYLN